MKVYNVIYRAEFDNDTFDDVYTYDSFDKAHDCLVDLAKGWFNEDLFDIEMPKHDIIWQGEKYNGFYMKKPNHEVLTIEETDNVVNYLSLRIEETNVH